MSYADGLNVPKHNSQTAIRGGSTKGPGIAKPKRHAQIMRAKPKVKRRLMAG